MGRTPVLQRFVDHMATELFGWDGDKWRCAICGNDITDFRDSLSVREFNISGMCQACQDDVFGGVDE